MNAKHLAVILVLTLTLATTAIAQQAEQCANIIETACGDGQCIIALNMDAFQRYGNILLYDKPVKCIHGFQYQIRELTGYTTPRTVQANLSEIIGNSQYNIDRAELAGDTIILWIYPTGTSTTYKGMSDVAGLNINLSRVNHILAANGYPRAKRAVVAYIPESNSTAHEDLETLRGLLNDMLGTARLEYSGELGLPVVLVSDKEVADSLVDWVGEYVSGHVVIIVSEEGVIGGNNLVGKTNEIMISIIVFAIFVALLLAKLRL